MFLLSRRANKLVNCDKFSTLATSSHLTKKLKFEMKISGPIIPTHKRISSYRKKKEGVQTTSYPIIGVYFSLQRMCFNSNGTLFYVFRFCFTIPNPKVEVKKRKPTSYSCHKIRCVNVDTVIFFFKRLYQIFICQTRQQRTCTRARRETRARFSYRKNAIIYRGVLLHSAYQCSGVKAQLLR